MKRLRADEIVGLGPYESVRDAYRDRIIAYKKRRRVPVGDNVTLLFEDRETLRFQIQEMLWVERISDPEKVLLEVEVYNELMPRRNELSATLFVEMTDPARMREELDRLVGIDEHVSLVVGDDVVRARFDPRQMEEDRISAVHYLKFRFGEERAERFADPSVPAVLRIDHPHYAEECALPPEVRARLIDDLAGDPEPLLSVPERPPRAQVAGEILFATGRVRALRAADHVIVEPIEPVGSLFDADPELVLELIDAVKRIAKQIVPAAGSCRVETRMGADADRLRFRVLS